MSDAVRRPCSDFMDMLRRLINYRIIIIIIIINAEYIGCIMCERFMFAFIRKITELEEELKIVTNNMKSLEIAEQEVTGIFIVVFIR